MRNKQAITGLLLARLALLFAVLGALIGATGETFTIVMLPDTQVYSERLPKYFHDQTKWIAENAAKENIVFVSHVGDIVQRGKLFPHEWDVADEAMRRLEGVVPYGTVIGNHDYDRGEDRSAPGYFETTWYKRFFGPQRFKKYDWYGGASSNGLNSYQTFQAGGHEFIALHLEIDFPDDAITWAEQVLARHPNALALVSIHLYLSPAGRPRSAYWLKEHGNSAEYLWQEFVRKHPQIFTVLCGHYGGEAYQVSLNLAKLPVYEILADYQNRRDGGEGWLRLIRIDTDRHEMRNETYSPSLDQWEEDADSKFTFPLNLAERLETVRAVREPARR